MSRASRLISWRSADGEDVMTRREIDALRARIAELEAQNARLEQKVAFAEDDARRLHKDKMDHWERAMNAEDKVARLQTLVQTAAGHLHWAATAEPGVTSATGRKLVLGWEEDLLSILKNL
jgi:predicted  nucleic acid-binding Zn-ribbon protein